MCAFFQNKRVETPSLVEQNLQICGSFSVSLILKIKNSPAFVVLDMEDKLKLLTAVFRFNPSGFVYAIEIAKGEFSRNFSIPFNSLNFSLENFVLGFAKEDKIDSRETHFHIFFSQEINFKEARELEGRNGFVKIVEYRVENNYVKIIFGGKKFPHNHFQAILEFVRRR